MSVTLITYHTPEYSRACRLLFRTAKKAGIDHVRAYTRPDLEATEFYARNKPILDMPRGNGYWLWKPYFIAESLRSLNENDILIYADSGIFFRNPVRPLLNLLQGENDTAFFYNNFRMGKLTKRDIFVELGCDTEDYYKAPMVHAGFQMFRKTKGSLQFAEEVLRYSAFNRLITDDPSSCGLPELPGFVENRHDQSILSLLIHKHRRRIFLDPSQLVVKPCDYVFGQGDIELNQLPYQRIIYIHRYKNSEIWKLIPDVAKKVMGW